MGASTLDRRHQRSSVTNEDLRAELIENIRVRAADLADAIAGLSDDQMQEQTLDGWSVKDHLSHCAVWHEFRAAEIVRISAGYDTAWPGMPTDENNAFNEMTVVQRRGLSLAQVYWELESTQRRVIEALQHATERGLDESLYGESPPRTGHDSQHAGWIRRWRSERGY